MAKKRTKSAAAEQPAPVEEAMPADEMVPTPEEMIDSTAQAFESGTRLWAVAIRRDANGQVTDILGSTFDDRENMVPVPTWQPGASLTLVRYTVKSYRLTLLAPDGDLLAEYTVNYRRIKDTSPLPTKVVSSVPAFDRAKVSG